LTVAGEIRKAAIFGSSELLTQRFMSYDSVAMRKPVKRAIRLEEVLGDLIGTEETLLRLEMDQAFDALTEKQMRLYKEVLAKLRELVQDLSNDVAQEHHAA
jgi:hypothetical protein